MEHTNTRESPLLKRAEFGFWGEFSKQFKILICKYMCIFFLLCNMGLICTAMMELGWSWTQPPVFGLSQLTLVGTVLQQSAPLIKAALQLGPSQLWRFAGGPHICCVGCMLLCLRSCVKQGWLLTSLLITFLFLSQHLLSLILMFATIPGN